LSFLVTLLISDLTNLASFDLGLDLRRDFLSVLIFFLSFAILALSALRFALSLINFFSS